MKIGYDSSAVALAPELKIALMVEKTCRDGPQSWRPRVQRGALACEQAEYAHIIRLNDLLSMLKLQAEE